MFHDLSVFSDPAGPARDGGNVVTTPSLPQASSDSTTAIIGGVVAVVLIVAITFTMTVVVVAALILRSRRDKFKPNQRYNNNNVRVH